MAERKHDYALLAKILQEEPALEQTPTRLASRYRQLHPERRVLPVQSLKTILRKHGQEILGRPYKPGMSGTERQHDYNTIREIIRESPVLMNRPREVAAIYRIRTGYEINDVYMARLLREHPEEFTPQSAPTPTSEAAVERFAALMETYKQLNPREHDVLHLGDSAYYTDILADAIHYGLLNGIQPNRAINRAWATVALEYEGR